MLLNQGTLVTPWFRTKLHNPWCRSNSLGATLNPWSNLHPYSPDCSSSSRRRCAEGRCGRTAGAAAPPSSPRSSPHQARRRRKLTHTHPTAPPRVLVSNCFEVKALFKAFGFKAVGFNCFEVKALFKVLVSTADLLHPLQPGFAVLVAVGMCNRLL